MTQQQQLGAKKAYHTAVCLIPPAECWPQINAIRAKYDKAFARWMPHINLLFPFVYETEFPAGTKKLQEALDDVAPFEITFKEFGHFQHGKKSTMWLKPECNPENALIALQAKLEAAIPLLNDLSTRGDHGFSPHLTRQIELAKTEFGKNFKEVKFRVEKISVINRGKDTPFVVHTELTLNGKPS